MTLSDMGVVAALSGTLVAGGGYIGKLIGDQQWVSQDQYLKTELAKTQKEIRLMEFKRQQNGSLSPIESFNLRELRDLEKTYLLELE